MLLLPFNDHATIFCFLLSLFEENKNMHFNSLMRETLHWNPFLLKTRASPYTSSYWNIGDLTTVLPWTAQLLLKGQKLERKGITRLSIQPSLIPSHAERELGAKSALITTQVKGIFACMRTGIKVTPQEVSEEVFAWEGEASRNQLEVGTEHQQVSTKTLALLPMES